MTSTMFPDAVELVVTLTVANDSCGSKNSTFHLNMYHHQNTKFQETVLYSIYADATSFGNISCW